MSEELEEQDEKYIRVTLSMPVRYHEMLRELARRKHVGMSAVVRMLVEREYSRLASQGRQEEKPAYQPARYWVKPSVKEPQVARREEVVVE